MYTITTSSNEPHVEVNGREFDDLMAVKEWLNFCRRFLVSDLVTVRCGDRVVARLRPLIWAFED